MKPIILLVDDEAAIRFGFSKYLTKNGYQVQEAATLAEAQEAVAGQRYDALLLDLGLPDGNGLDWIPALRENHPELPIIVITGAGDIPIAVEAMRRGADNLLTKPVDMASLEVFLRKTLELGSMRRKDYTGRRLAKTDEIYFGQSPTIRKVEELAALAADTDSVVLLLGESGTGKGMLAKWIHRRSSRRDQPFVEINCSALKGDMLASELFGAARGAYTSAVQDRPGLIEVADRGSLFLDEVGDMEWGVQAQFLKVIEEKSFRRIGDVKQRRSDFRLLGATNKDLPEEVAQGRFRKELYFRIQVFPILLPPLRERPEDIEGLATHLLQSLEVPDSKLSPEILGLFWQYPWPGNIRELRNVLERGLLLSRGEPLAPSHFPGLETITWKQGGPERRKVSDEAEALRLKAVLKDCDGDVNRAARILGISRATFYRKLKQLKT